MKAPARLPSTSSDGSGSFVFAIPALSISRAISAGL